ncbi:hypothetical protein CVT24_006132 [Panaeolus cyanescens]|uniref:F-box domain-containing protein n=1 Tax=Panaeolus cyanescens TaxID=181874 RepID=A0A409WZK0_9AGAR|nr:hypothetical protein CVT24_006132 [Panaeolus cyanescens]
MSKCSSLTELTLRGSFKDMNRLPALAYKLTRLNLETDERQEILTGLSGAFELLWRTDSQGSSPISWLTDFSVVILVDADLPILHRMLNDLHHLRSLEINGLLSDRDDTFSFNDIKLQGHLQSSFPSLSALSFSFWHYDGSPVISTFIDMLNTLPVTHLKSFKIVIDKWLFLWLDEEKHYTLDDILLPHLAKIVSRLWKVQRLEELEVVLKFHNRSFADEGSDDAFDWDDRVGTLSDDGFLPQLQASVQLLEKNCGLENAVFMFYFTPIVISDSAFMRPRMVSRSVIIRVYPKIRR